MRILSQNCKITVNFDNITMLCVESLECDKKTNICIITATDVNGQLITLGAYNNESKAKEVLKQIFLNSYEIYQMPYEA